MASDEDLVGDIIGRLAKALGVDMTHSEIQKVERAIRSDWGGCQVYISADRNAQRDALLYEQWCAGDAPKVLAKRYRITVRQVRRIIAKKRRT